MASEIFCDENKEQDAEKLVMIYGEILFLRDRMADLEAEAEVLKETTGR